MKSMMTKKILSGALAAALVGSMAMTATPFAFAAEQKNGISPDEYYVSQREDYVFFDNSETKWAKVYAYWWSIDFSPTIDKITGELFPPAKEMVNPEGEVYYGQDFRGFYPGIEMTQIPGTDVWQLRVPVGATKMIFNNGVTDEQARNGKVSYQTMDLDFDYMETAGKICVIDTSVAPLSGPGLRRNIYRYQNAGFESYYGEYIAEEFGEKIEPLVNTSTVASDKITLGSSVTVNCSSEGGKDEKQYAVYYKQASQTSYTCASTLSDRTVVSFTPKAATTYNIRTKVKDATGKVVVKDMNVTVSGAVLKNTSTVSSGSVDLGSSFTVNCSSTGGTGTKQYAVYYKQSNQTSYTCASALSTRTSVVITPKAATTYNIRTKVKDGSGKVVVKDMNVTVSGAVLKNTSTVSSGSVNLGSSFTVNCSSTDGIGTKQYAVYYKQASQTTYTCASALSTRASVAITPKAATTYNIRTKVKDGSGKVVVKDMNVTVSGAVLKNTSTVSSGSVNLGSSFTVNCSSTGGIGTKQYAVYYKQSSQTSYTCASALSTRASVVITPKAATTYNIRTKVKDGSGKVVVKDINVTVKNPPLVNTSSLSAASITLGSKITVKCSSTGGKGTVQYSVFYKQQSESEWITASNYSTNASVIITPKAVNSYNIRVKAKDTGGTVVAKDLILTVLKDPNTTETQKKSYSFILNKSTMVYHTRECPAAQKIKAQNKEYITLQAYTYSEAVGQLVEMGYSLCHTC